MTTRSTPRTNRAIAAKGKMATRAEPPAKLRVAMTGKAGQAKAEEGDKPAFAYVGRQATLQEFLSAKPPRQATARCSRRSRSLVAYIATLPQPQRAIAERLDALAAKTLPDLQRAVKWGMAYYGVDGGWCFSSGAFVGHVKLMFIRGTDLQPEPPVTPIAMGKSTRGVELTSVNDLDEHQVASWIKQATTMPFVGGKKKR